MYILAEKENVENQDLYRIKDDFGFFQIQNFVNFLI